MFPAITDGKGASQVDLRQETIDSSAPRPGTQPVKLGIMPGK